MSYYVGCGGKIIVREEFRDLAENRLDLTGTTDPVFMLCNDLGPENLFYRTVQWEKWFKEIIEIYEYDEEHARDWPVDSSWKNTLQEQIENRDRTIREICDELKNCCR